MGFAANIVTSITTAVMAILPASCSKTSSKAGAGAQTGAAVVSSNAVAGADASGGSDSKTRNLGELSLTNNYEFTVRVAKDTTCLIVPKLLDRHNVQLTLSLQKTNTAGAVQGFTMTQVTGTAGKPFDVTLGDMDITFTPMVVAN
jgi:hypothetical protein